MAGSNCTWRLAEPVKKVWKNCSDAAINSYVEKKDPKCFKACAAATASGKPNRTSPCYVGCFFDAVLGPHSDTVYVVNLEIAHSMARCRSIVQLVYICMLHIYSSHRVNYRQIYSMRANLLANLFLYEEMAVFFAFKTSWAELELDSLQFVLFVVSFVCLLTLAQI